MADEKGEMLEGTEASGAAAAREPGAGDGSAMEVTRREFVRRAAMVSGLAGFALVGADALLDAVLRRMEALQTTRGVADAVGRTAHAAGFLRSAEASALSGNCNDGGHYEYCRGGNPFLCGGRQYWCGDNEPGGFRCDAGTSYVFGCAPNSACANDSSGTVMEFRCSRDFDCNTKFHCGEIGGAGQFNCQLFHFECKPLSGFSCDNQHGSFC